LSWPTPQDYNESIQSPHLNFNDPELKGGSVETNAFGLPRPISGGFASVYKVNCGHREWAVRCFLREFLDQQQRYEAISKHLSATKLPYMVGFDFLPQGIKVRGKWYPILKMEWVRGELLHKYIKRNLHNPSVLLDLADRWMAMLKALQAANIAHGDLQHGNVLITSGYLRLIDYDGIYVPALAGQISHEVGHRNYQHPLRTQFDFGPRIDNFAAWVIYISLLALSIDPSLWDQAKAGDENLLFRRVDFEEPHSSHILTLLSKHPDQRLYTLANFFQSILYGSLTQLPSLDGQTVIQGVTAPSHSTAAGGGAVGKPSWLQDYISDPQEGKNTPASGASPIADSTWVIDHLLSPVISGQKLLETELLTPRLALIACATTCGMCVALNLILLVSIILTVLSILFVGALTGTLLRYLYRRSPVVATMLEVVMKEEEQTRVLNTSRREIRILEAKKSEALKKQKEEDRAINSQRSALQNKEQQDKERVEARLKAEINKANALRQEINSKEAVAVQQVQAHLGGIVSGLNRQISALSQAETSELSSTLSTLRKQAITSYLLCQPIEQATIKGIGDKLKARLRVAGIRTAADVEYARVTRVEGIGESKARSLLAWRDHLASFAKVPSALSPGEINAIKAKYNLQKRQLESQRDASWQRLNAEVQTIKTRFANEIKVINDGQNIFQNKANQEIQSISAQYALSYATLSQTQSIVSSGASEQCQALNEEIDQLRRKMGEQHWQLTKTRRDLLAYSNVSFKTYLRMVMGFV